MSVTDGLTLQIIDGDFFFDLNRQFRDAHQKPSVDRPVTVDLSRPQYPDSAGLGMLIRLRKQVGGNNGSVTLSGTNDAIHTVLEVANLGQLSRIT